MVLCSHYLCLLPFGTLFYHETLDWSQDLSSGYMLRLLQSILDGQRFGFHWLSVLGTDIGTLGEESLGNAGRQRTEIH